MYVSVSASVCNTCGTHSRVAQSTKDTDSGCHQLNVFCEHDCSVVITTISTKTIWELRFAATLGEAL